MLLWLSCGSYHKQIAIALQKLQHGLHTCRAILVQLGFYMHMQYVLGATSYVVSQPVVFVMAFMLLFSVVIALFKDIPDISGDSQVSCHEHTCVHAGVVCLFEDTSIMQCGMAAVPLLPPACLTEMRHVAHCYSW